MVVRKHHHQHYTRNTGPFLSKYRGTLLYMKLTKDYGNIFPVVKLRPINFPTTLNRTRGLPRVKLEKHAWACLGFNSDTAGHRKNGAHDFLVDDLKARCESEFPVVVVEDISKRLTCRLSKVQWSIIDAESDSRKTENMDAKLHGKTRIKVKKIGDKTESKTKNKGLILRSPHPSDCNDCSVILERYDALPPNCLNTDILFTPREDIAMSDTCTTDYDPISNGNSDKTIDATDSSINDEVENVCAMVDSEDFNHSDEILALDVSLAPDSNISDVGDNICAIVNKDLNHSNSFLGLDASLPPDSSVSDVGGNICTMVNNDDLNHHNCIFALGASLPPDSSTSDVGDNICATVYNEDMNRSNSIHALDASLPPDPSISDVGDSICATVDREDLDHSNSFLALDASLAPSGTRTTDNVKREEDATNKTNLDFILEDDQENLSGTIPLVPVSDTIGAVREKQTYTLLFDEDPTKSEFVEIEQATADGNSNHIIQDLTNLLINNGIRSSLTNSLQKTVERNVQDKLVESSLVKDTKPAQTLVPCSVCHASFRSGKQIKDHKEVCVVRELRSNKHCSCRECTFSYQSEAALMRHAAYHNGVANIMCKVCGLTFLTSFAFDSHRRSHQESS